MADKRYTLKPTTTPLASASASADGASHAADESIRAENEDDDGYDPYSDRREQRPLFEENPWE